MAHRVGMTMKMLNLGSAGESLWGVKSTDEAMLINQRNIGLSSVKWG